MKAGILQYLSPGLKMFLLFIMMLVSVMLVSLFVGMLGFYLYGEIDFDPQLLMSDIRIVKLLQLFQSVFVFVIPSVIAAFLFFPSHLSSLYGGNRVNLYIILASGLAIFISQYFIGWTGYVNSQLVLPESWEMISKWIEQTEKEALEITMQLTGSNSGTGFLVNIIILAVVPAIGEEWLFRGHIQRYFGEWMGGVHLPVFATSVLFAAMHLQFMTFLPRFFLSVILGYMFFYGGNLWYSIIGHFINNFLALLMMRNVEEVTTVTNSLESQPDIPFSLGVLFSFLGVIALLFFIRRVRYVANE